MFKYYIATLLLFFNLSHAELKISSYKQNEWSSKWSEVLVNKFTNEEIYQKMLGQFIDEDDLINLKCPDYNYASNEEKIDFWIVFFASLIRSESGLNEKAISPKSKGQRNYGLLQLALKTAQSQCNLETKDDVFDGEKNITCGLKLLNWQLNGASGKRPDLVGQLFGKKILLWGPLRQNDIGGRKRLYDFFFKHLDQLPFCQLD